VGEVSDYSRRPTIKNVEAHCGECGREFYRFYTATHQKYCPDCQRERNLENQRRAYIAKGRDCGGERFSKRKGVCTVIYDPLSVEEGGFKPGAKLFVCEINILRGWGFVQKGFTYEQEGERRTI
jgi:hypothetical protein